MKVSTGIQEKIASAMKQAAVDLLLLTGPDSITWVTGVSLPFVPSMFYGKLAVLVAPSGAVYCVCPAHLASSMEHQGIAGELLSYNLYGDDSTAFLDVMLALIQRLQPEPRTIGFDGNRMSAEFTQAMQEQCAGKRFSDVGDWILELRSVKTSDELELLEEAAFRTDHGINGQFHHTLSAKQVSLMGLAENVRVHCMERFLDEAGYSRVSRITTQDKPGRFFPFDEIHGFNYGFCELKKTVTGQMYTVSMNATYQGYWSTGSRILSYGSYTEAQERDYAQINRLRALLLDAIKPGLRCSDVYHKVRAAAITENINLVPDIGFGHGVGVCVREAPYLTEDCDMLIKADMVLVLDQAVYGQHGEILRSKDTILVSETDNRLLNWWKDWREPYFPIEFL